MTGNLRILLTGACGYLAAQVRPALGEAYDLRLVDVKDTDARGQRVPGVALADLADPDRTKYARLFREIDVVVHFAHKHPGGIPWGAGLPPIDRFDDEFLNIRMAQHVYRSAFDAGVRRVVMASSNHAADWYEHNLIHTRMREIVSASDLPLSDNFYGWAKASYELLGFTYACGALGRKLQVIQLRIGAPRDVSWRHYAGGLRQQHAGPGGAGLENFKRELGAYLSERDFCQLLQRAIEAPNIENEYGVPWLVVYGISNNTRAFWSLESARRVLGYDPVDDSEITYADDIRRILTGPEARAPGGRVGARPGARQD
ncbi:MAG TPA: NAD(P)-dependent oxidoreductase [bacterium]|nr:NAD(P)-dependent oxidoreductase [bacterium]